MPKHVRSIKKLGGFTLLLLHGAEMARNNLPSVALRKPPYARVPEVARKWRTPVYTGQFHANRDDRKLCAGFYLPFRRFNHVELDYSRSVQFKVVLFANALAEVIGEDQVGRNQLIQRSNIRIEHGKPETLLGNSNLMFSGGQHVDEGTTFGMSLRSTGTISASRVSGAMSCSGGQVTAPNRMLA